MFRNSRLKKKNKSGNLNVVVHLLSRNILQPKRFTLILPQSGSADHTNRQFFIINGTSSEYLVGVFADKWRLIIEIDHFLQTLWNFHLKNRISKISRSINNWKTVLICSPGITLYIFYSLCDKQLVRLLSILFVLVIFLMLISFWKIAYFSS